jgi:hypothetical protein
MSTSANRRRVVMHVDGEEPFLAELEEVPDPALPFVRISNPTRPGGGQPEWVTRGTISYLFSWTHIKYIEMFENTTTDALPFPGQFK